MSPARTHRSGYSRTPRLIKGALVRLSDRFVVPEPTIIPFQYNPETLARSLEPWLPDEEGGTGSTAVAQPTDPKESFDVELVLDASDDLEDPAANPTAALAGVADRVAALEMLLYPETGGFGELLGETAGGLAGGAVVAVAGAAVGAGAAALGGAVGGALASLLGKAARPTVPVVLFVFGPGLVVPVRLTSFRVEEQAFSPRLYPLRARVTVGLEVLRPEAGELSGYPEGASRKLAELAYAYTKKQRRSLAGRSDSLSFGSGAEAAVGAISG